MARVSSHEVSYVRFCEKPTMPNGTSTDVEHPRSMFLIPCNLGSDPFTLFLELSLPFPRTVSKAIHFLSSSLSGDSVCVGGNEEIVLQKAEKTDGDFTIFQCARSQTSTHIDGKLRPLIARAKEGGILGIFYYDNTLAIETIYDTPSNFHGSRQLVKAEDLWSLVDSLARSL